MQNPEALITLVLYAGLLVGIGLWASSKVKSEDSFLLAGRNLGAIVAGLAYAASSSSAWVLLGFSGFVYSVGLSAFWMVPGILAGYAVVWFWVGGVLQRASHEKGHLTLTDFIAEGLSPKAKKWIQVFGSLMIAYCFCWYIAAQLQGAGQAFDDLFGSGLARGVQIGAGRVLLYEFFGGFVAVALVDMLQGLLIAIVAIVLPVAAFLAVGGVDGITTALAAAPPAYSDVFGGRAGFIALGFVLGISATGFGALGQPHLIAWIMAARDRKARISGGTIAVAWGLLVYAGMGLLGLCARAFFGSDMAAEGIFFGSATEFLPGIFAGIIAAATLSAIMSTVDSQLLVAGAALGHDLGIRKLFPGRDVLVSRLCIAAMCAASIGVTLLLPSSIFSRVLFAWVALGAAFGPVVVARSIGWRPSAAGTIAAMLAGFLCSVVLTFILAKSPGEGWSTIMPWGVALLVLAGDRLASRKARADLRTAPASPHE